MASHDDLRRVALALPATREAADRVAFSVLNKGKEKGFAWVWNERVEAKKPRVPRPDVIAIRVPNLEEKEVLLASDTTKFFTEAHYNGFPAVLVRLAAVDVDELEELIVDAWRCQAPRTLVKEYLDRCTPQSAAGTGAPLTPQSAAGTGAPLTPQSAAGTGAPPTEPPPQ